jgi:transposase
LVFSRNPEREARLLEEWRKGSTAREAATNTGIPEGTTYYYYRKFNRDPEKANRLAKSLKPAKQLTPQEVMLQAFSVQNADQAMKKIHKLMDEGKFAEADSYIKAELGMRRLSASLWSGINSYRALFFSDPDVYGSFASEAVREMIQAEMATGVTYLQAIEQLEQAWATQMPLLPPGKPMRGAVLMAAALLDLKKEYLARQEAKKKDEEKDVRSRASQDYSISELLKPSKVEQGRPKTTDWLGALQAQAKEDTEKLEKLMREDPSITVHPIEFKEAPHSVPGTEPTKKSASLRSMTLSDLLGPRAHDRPMPSDMMGQGSSTSWPGRAKKKSSGPKPDSGKPNE